MSNHAIVSAIRANETSTTGVAMAPIVQHPGDPDRIDGQWPDHSLLAGAWDGRTTGLLPQVQIPLNLILPLKTPAMAPALGAYLLEHMDGFHAGVLNLRYVHDARFIIPPDGSCLMVMTTFDGDFDSYLMDFVASMADLFTGVMFFVKDAPPLPVEKYPNEFRNFVARHSVAHQGVVSAYPGMTVLEVLRAGGMRGNELRPAPPIPLPRPIIEETTS
jgi:hypothetical protein